MTSSHIRPRFVELTSPRDVAGVTARTSNAREADPATAALPALWGRFMAAGGSPSTVFSVYTDYESDVHGAYTVVLGREAGRSTSGERTVRVVPGRYAVFTSTGDMPAAVIAGWQAVWAYFAEPDAPARAYTTDFEQYEPDDPSTVHIHVAVRGGAAHEPPA